MTDKPLFDEILAMVDKVPDEEMARLPINLASTFDRRVELQDEGTLLDPAMVLTTGPGVKIIEIEPGVYRAVRDEG